MNIYYDLVINAKDKPNKVCIYYNNEKITFLEIYKMANALGSSLRYAGIKKGNHISIALHNSPEFIISYMGILGIGAVAVPVNPNLTARELEYIMTDSDSRGLIIEEKNINTYNKIKDKIHLTIVLTTGEGGSFKNFILNTNKSSYTDVDLDDTAVLLYSSGLAGYPMGCMITHKNLLHNSDVMKYCFNCDHNDTTLSVIPIFHGFGTCTNILSMLRYGGSIYLMRRLSFEDLFHILDAKLITVICSVPSFYYGLLNHPKMKEINFDTVHTIVSGGSKLPGEIYDEFKKRYNKDIRQGYGLTEASPICTVNNKHIPIKPLSIGKTVHEVEARVVDDNGKDLLPGEDGELIFKGPNIMKGYYKNEIETAKIIKNSWLYTGDLGYKDEDGYLYITGFKKDMVITSGFNVYCKEVENVIKSMPGISDVAITGVPDIVRGSIVKAYVVRNDNNIDEEVIKRYSKEYLTSYKIPRKIVFVDNIPRDRNAKPLFNEIENNLMIKYPC